MVAIGLTGCAQRGWTKAGAGESEFSADSYACAQETRGQEASFKPFRGMQSKPTVYKDLYRACMRVRGYQFVEGGAWEGFRD